MGYRNNIDGLGMALSCDKTTTGARLLTSIPLSQVNIFGFGVIRVGDKTTPCPACGNVGTVVEGAKEYRRSFMGVQVAVDRCEVICGCPRGSNRIIAPLGQWLGAGKSPAQQAAEYGAASAAVLAAALASETQRRAEERDHNRVFAKSCLRGDGCNDAGEAQEPHTNFADMAILQAVPGPAADAVTNTDVPQRAQAAKKKPASQEAAPPEPKKRSGLYRLLFGNQEEIDLQAEVAEAASAKRAQTATAEANVLVPILGRAVTSGTWAVRLGQIATGGPGAPIAGLLVGMLPGKLNDGEQDFIDRMRAEQMREAPTRVRFTWENDDKGDPVPHGWHTPPGKDMVRVRKMAWDDAQQAYTFTTEEEKPVTIIWTPDHSGVHVPSNTGNQARPVLPSSVIVDPLPESAGITTTTSPAPEEKGFADYILILPMPNIPPIYIYLSKPPVEFMEVELYSDFKRRSRQGKYEADHMPSKAAVKAHLRRVNPKLDETILEELAQDVAAIVVPKDVHQKLSATYGGRNTPAQIDFDSRNLRAALDRNLDAIKPALKVNGATESQIEAARTKMHKLNSDMELYK